MRVQSNAETFAQNCVPIGAQFVQKNEQQNAACLLQAQIMLPARGLLGWTWARGAAAATAREPAAILVVLTGISSCCCTNTHPPPLAAAAGTGTAATGTAALPPLPPPSPPSLVPAGPPVPAARVRGRPLHAPALPVHGGAAGQSLGTCTARPCNRSRWFSPQTLRHPRAVPTRMQSLPLSPPQYCRARAAASLPTWRGRAASLAGAACLRAIKAAAPGSLRFC